MKLLCLFQQHRPTERRTRLVSPDLLITSRSEEVQWETSSHICGHIPCRAADRKFTCEMVLAAQSINQSKSVVARWSQNRVVDRPCSLLYDSITVSTHC